VPPIEIMMNVDADGIFNVTAQDNLTGKPNNIMITDEVTCQRELEIVLYAENEKIVKQKTGSGSKHNLQKTDTRGKHNLQTTDTKSKHDVQTTDSGGKRNLQRTDSYVPIYKLKQLKKKLAIRQKRNLRSMITPVQLEKNIYTDPKAGDKSGDEYEDIDTDDSEYVASQLKGTSSLGSAAHPNVVHRYQQSDELGG